MDPQLSWWLANEPRITTPFVEHVEQLSARIPTEPPPRFPFPRVACFLRFTEADVEGPTRPSHEIHQRRLDQARRTQRKVRTYLQTTGFYFDSYWAVNAITVQVPWPRLLEFLAEANGRGGASLEWIDHLRPLGRNSSPELDDILIKEVARLKDPRPPTGAIVAPRAAVAEVHRAEDLRPLDGTDVAVAVIDSGLDSTHKDLHGPWPDDRDLLLAGPSSGEILAEVGVGETFIQHLILDATIRQFVVRLVFGLARPNSGPFVQAPLTPKMDLTLEGPGVSVAVPPPTSTLFPTAAGGQALRLTWVCPVPAPHLGELRVAVRCSGVEAVATFPWRRALFKMTVEGTDANGQPKDVHFLGREDDLGHGTLVAGIIAGLGARHTGRFRGLAPGVRLYPIKALVNPAAAVNSSDAIIKAFNWLNLRDDIRLVNISLSSDNPCNRQNPPCAVCLAVERAIKDHHKIVVVSAGNKTGHVSCPGPVADAITVGSATWEQPRRVSTFSGYAGNKPDVLAVGEDVVGPRARFALSQMELGQHGLQVRVPRGLVVHDAYVTGSGTSFSPL